MAAAASAQPAPARPHGDHPLLRQASAGLQEDLMIVMLRMLQTLAGSCAAVCSERMRGLHEKMAQSFEADLHRRVPLSPVGRVERAGMPSRASFHRLFDEDDDGGFQLAEMYNALDEAVAEDECQAAEVSADKETREDSVLLVMEPEVFTEPPGTQASAQMEACALKSSALQPPATLDPAHLAVNKFMTFQDDSALTTCLATENNSIDSSGTPSFRKGGKDLEADESSLDYSDVWVHDQNHKMEDFWTRGSFSEGENCPSIESGMPCTLRVDAVLQREPSLQAPELARFKGGTAVSLLDWDATRGWRRCWQAHGPDCGWLRLKDDEGRLVLWPDGIPTAAEPLPSISLAVYENNIQDLLGFIVGGFDLGARDAAGNTPLMLAVQLQRLDCCALLIRAGADALCPQEGTGRIKERGWAKALIHVLASDEQEAEQIAGALAMLRPDTQDAMRASFEPLHAEQSMPSGGQ